MFLTSEIPLWGLGRRVSFSNVVRVYGAGISAPPLLPTEGGTYQRRGALRSRVLGVGCRLKGVECRVEGVWWRVQGVACSVGVAGRRVQGVGNISSSLSSSWRHARPSRRGGLDSISILPGLEIVLSPPIFSNQTVPTPISRRA